MQKTEKACFGAGCFWGTEYIFSKFPGVVNKKVGYMGGSTKNPTYESICTDKTGHAEVILIEFDPKIINYEKLLEIFFKCHDPTTLNRQGPDIGTQYRSAIFYYSPEQKKKAGKYKEEYQKIINKKVVTSIEPAKTFYLAEEYHQEYYAKSGKVPYCHILPKIKM